MLIDKVIIFISFMLLVSSAVIHYENHQAVTFVKDKKQEELERIKSRISSCEEISNSSKLRKYYDVIENHQERKGDTWYSEIQLEIDICNHNANIYSGYCKMITSYYFFTDQLTGSVILGEYDSTDSGCERYELIITNGRDTIHRSDEYHRFNSKVLVPISDTLVIAIHNYDYNGRTDRIDTASYERVLFL